MRFATRLAARLLLLVAALAPVAAGADAQFPSNLPAVTYGKVTLPPNDRGSSGDLSGFCLRTSPTQPCQTLNLLPTAFNAAALGVKGDGSDESAALRLATQIATLAGRPLWIPPTMTVRVVQWEIPYSRAHIILDGTVKLRDGGVGNVIAVSSENTSTPTAVVDGVTIEGTGTIDGNRAKAGSYTGALACIHAYRVSNFTLRGLNLTQCKNFPINAWNGSSNILIDSVKASYSGNSAECAATVDNCWVRNSRFEHIDDYGWAFYGGVTNSGITDSVSRYNGAGGIVVLADGSTNTTTGSTNITIANNVVQYNYAAGVHVQADSPSTGLHQGITVTGNKSDHNNQGNLPPYGFAYLKNAINVTVADNISHDEGNGNTTVVGVQLGTNLTNVKVRNNQFTNLGVGGTGVGIGVTAGIVGLDIGGNTVADYKTTKTLAYGLNGSVGNGTSARVQGNTVIGYVIAADNLTYGNDTIRDPIWKAYTPTISMAQGTLGGSAVTNSFYSYDGRTLNMTATITVSALGSGAGALRVSTPEGLTPSSICPGNARESTGGAIWSALINPGQTFISLVPQPGGPALAAGNQITANLTCRIQ